MMAAAAAYDEIADWYEGEFLARTAAAGADVLGIERAVQELLGTGRGVCLEIGCGTGVRAAQVRSLGWTLQVQTCPPGCSGMPGTASRLCSLTRDGCRSPAAVSRPSSR
jgi:hypothetical protein